MRAEVLEFIGYTQPYIIGGEFCFHQIIIVDTFFTIVAVAIFRTQQQIIGQRIINTRTECEADIGIGCCAEIGVSGCQIMFNTCKSHTTGDIRQLAFIIDTKTGAERAFPFNATVPDIITCADDNIAIFAQIRIINVAFKAE